MHHTASPSQQQVHAHIPLFEPFVLAALPADPPRVKPGKRGAPQQMSWPHLWFRLIFCVLRGMHSYQDLRRDLAEQPLGPFPRLSLTDDAIVDRLKKAGVGPLQDMLAHLSEHLGRLLSLHSPCHLASFATALIALDETTWDAVQRHLPALRTLPKGEVGLLPGKLAARFNLRTQLFEFVQFRDLPLGNCKLDVCSLLQGVPVGALLLFDLGYFSYAFFDYLSECGFWYISRIREDAHYQIAHTFYRHEGTLDALVWLGGQGRNCSRTARLVRLVRFWDGRALRTYLTNQTDPRLLPLPDVARLYARRWDIELAFLTLKEHLDLHHWWSAHPVLRKQQALVVLIVSQLLHATRLLIAAEQGCDPFEVSLPLLVKYVPDQLIKRQHLVVWACRHGHDLGLFRPSSRRQIIVPDPPFHEYVFPPPDLRFTRLGSYREYEPRPHRASRHASKTSSGSASRFSGSAQQLSLFSPSVLRRLKKVHK
jgi:hypothetical protein